jgi:hypothetical protein
LVLTAHSVAWTQGSTLPVKITVYDHAIRAFGGEFGARKPGACGYLAMMATIQ